MLPKRYSFNGQFFCIGYFHESTRHKYPIICLVDICLVDIFIVFFFFQNSQRLSKIFNKICKIYKYIKKEATNLMALALYGFSLLVNKACRTCMQITYPLCVIYECSNYKFVHLIILYFNSNVFNVITETCSIRGRV
jgi:hypothetical protein